MAEAQLAVDVSNYSGPLVLEQARCLRAAGRAPHRRYAGGLDHARATAIGGRAGITVDAYVYLYWRRDVRGEVVRALETIAGLPVGRLWLDCEDDPPGIPPETIVELIDAAAEACAPFPAGIYTGRWWWPRATADSARFSHLPLWHAQYTRSADERPDFDGFAAYGGWTTPLMWQFQGTTSLCGVSVDLNLREANVNPAPEDDLDRIELALLRAGQRFDRARALGRYVLRPAPDDPAAVELQRVEDGRGVSFEPPYLLAVDDRLDG